MKRDAAMDKAGTVTNTVLVVEAEPAIAAACARVLGREGYRVEVVVDGWEAVDVLSKRSYALTILDMRTPRMNGREVYQYLLERHPEQAEHVVFTTGDLLDEDLRLFLESTGRPFLSKPFGSEELRAIVRQTMQEVRK